MKSYIDCSKNNGILMASASGPLDAGGIKKLAEEMLATGRGRGVKAFLVDCKNTLMTLSVLEIDRLPETFINIGFGPECKTAVLINLDSKNSELFIFLQNVFSLYLLQFQIFSKLENATAWLKKKLPSMH